MVDDDTITDRRGSADGRPAAVEQAAPVVRARGIGARSRRGWVFRDVELDIHAGELIALTGPAGSGRTSLLLALAGRFVINHGAIERTQRAALGYVPGVSEPEPGLTVAEHVEERLLLLGRARWRRRWRRQLVAAALTSYPGDPDRLVRTLDTYHLHLLGLVLARVERPGLIVVDDADADLSATERAELWARLRALSRDGTAVVAACREIDPGVPDRVVTLESHR
ncbi:ATP-binding cassette domain-containing protein [Planosporangium thailandense]|uniref:ATP-binding cassette domain-containing protein n=1 Tax=Planosporangium thailandense TaxID=765197 RepID=A0ABX0Y4C3_9ACTN|nr:ATP-binding cassette domain-containing protein [Planosporangium thailandense]NJC72260.1 ATP-binding cassette domain-containing protein [Planosporangium thailandense]